MNKFLPFLIIPLFLMPNVVSAESIYSNVAVTSNVTNPGNITGSPDGNATTFNSTSAFAEPGFSTVSSGDVVMQYTVDSTAIYSMTVWFMNGASIEHTALVSFLGTSPTGTETISNINNVTFDRIRIIPEAPLFGVDSVWIDIASAEPVDTAPDPSVPAVPSVADDDTYTVISEPLQTVLFPGLIKLISDNDDSTQHDTAVYAVDSTGKRRPFSSESVYFSWFRDFKEVDELYPAEMSVFPLGAAMPMHHGTWLVKIQSANDVYAVERGGVLRRIPDETTALYYYGPDWARRVRDIPPTDLPRYTRGSDLSNVHPNDSIVRDQNLVVWHIQNGVKRQIPDNDLTFHGINDSAIVYSIFSVLNPSLIDLINSYTIGTMYNRTDDFGWYSF